MQRLRILVRGTVQGVGFRPFVYRNAVELGLRGWVRNDSAGVVVEAEGDETAVAELCRRIVEDPPPLATVTGVETAPATTQGDREFTIVTTATSGAPTAPVAVDTATCDACLEEVDDPSNRRYRYPFTNCTDCGPRYTIVERIPYDRQGTTMAGFTMCAACDAEYHDPGDRRFHAQPNACPDCGPMLEWRRPGTAAERGEAALQAAIDTLGSGGIVALKGIGGYHLAVDATDDAAVGELRRRKARDDKPFAVMVADLDGALAICALESAGVEALIAPRRPIVVAPRHPGAGVSGAVAPGLTELGVFLPYSPLHHLLVAGAGGRPLVMTSGNLSDEPIAHDDADAVARLGGMADGVLSHDRRIHIRCDDSVVRVRPGRGVQVLRRSRGLAPEPRPLPIAARRPVLAVGAELKSAVAVTTGRDVVASHHIGDLEHLASYQSFVQAIDHLCHLYDVRPEVVAHDLHPEYLSTKFAMDLDVETCPVQHHHAHAASCMAEHGRSDPVVALTFDGLGYGCDGTLWGGEVLVADLRGFERAGHLTPVTMPGGTAAIREPWRMGVAWSFAAGIDPPFEDDRTAAVTRLVELAHGPVTTSMGRLFDALAALLGLRTTVTYEGQAAVHLEAAARLVPRREAPAYDVGVDATSGVIDPAPLVAAAVSDLRRGVRVPLIAAGVHEALGSASARLAASVARSHGIDTVVLTGGVFQNVRLSEVVEDAVVAAGLRVLTHSAVPANDGGICIGQAAVVAALS